VRRHCGVSLYPGRSGLLAAAGRGSVSALRQTFASLHVVTAQLPFYTAINQWGPGPGSGSVMGASGARSSAPQTRSLSWMEGGCLLIKPDTHTHTYAHTHTYTCARTHTHKHAHTRGQTHEHIRHTHIFTQTCAHKHTHTCTDK
jgi:hypothetical protein